jgi:hypothetical protein
MAYEYNGRQPGVYVVGDDGNDAYQHDAYYDEILPDTKAANKKGKKDKNDKNDKSTKEKKPAAPIIPSFEGYMFTVLDATKPGETASWVRTHKTQIPVSSQELYSKAVAHERKSGLGLSGQFQALGTNQQLLVNRLVAEKNAAEKESNAAWTLFGVRKNYEEHRTTFKTWRVNNAIRVTLQRSDKTKDVVPNLPGSKFPLGEIDKANIVDLREPVIKKEKEKDKDKDSVPKEKKKKKQAAANAVPQHYENQQYGDPYQQPNYAYNPEPYPAYEEQRPQQHGGWPQHQAQQDPFDMHDMSGALPEGAIPAPPLHHYQQEYRPEAPMPPQQPQYHHQEQHPFQPNPNVFPQAQPAFDSFDERQSRHPVAHEQQHISARHPSHSRHRSQSRRRESVDSERLRVKETRKIADVVRDGVREAMREAAAEDKVLHRWPTGGSGSAGSSSRSGGHEDYWSNGGSSGDRRQSYSTPGTSPDRGERYYERPSPQLRRRDSSGPRPYVDERKRYYMDRQKDYVIRPHDTYRDNNRDVRYPRDRRQGHDDYPTAHQRRPSRDRQYDRPRIQRRVTDYPEAFHDADFGRSGRSVDYERARPYDRDDRRRYARDERRGGRNREPVYQL